LCILEIDSYLPSTHPPGGLLVICGENMGNKIKKNMWLVNEFRGKIELKNV
jgi:hypothetical protein